MNEEIIKKLIQLTPEQQALLELAENAIAALCRSGIGLFYDYEEYVVRAINCNVFNHTEVDDGRYENEWKQNGYVTVPYWKGKPMADYFCFMCTDAIVDTYHRAFTEWRDNIVYITELSLVLNWKIWQWYEKNDNVARVYNDLWNECHDWCCDNLSGSDAEYYYRTTD